MGPFIHEFGSSRGDSNVSKNSRARVVVSCTASWTRRIGEREALPPTVDVDAAVDFGFG